MERVGLPAKTNVFFKERGVDNTKMKHLLVICAFLLMQGALGASAQELNITNINQTSDTLEIEIILNNKSAADIFVVSPNPRERSKTVYFLTFDDTTKEVQIKRGLYSFPPYVIIEHDSPFFYLTRVRPGESHKEVVQLAYPRSPDNLPVPTTIDLRSARSIRFELGVLPFDQSISEILSKKPFGNGVNGDERIVEGPYRGKALIEVQKVLSSKSHKLD